MGASTPTVPSDPGMDTPLAPFDDPSEASAEAAQGGRGRARHRSTREAAPDDVSPGAFRTGLGYAARAWRALLIVLLVHLLLGLTVVLPFQSALARHIGHHGHAPALAGAPDLYDQATGWSTPGLDAEVWTDTRRHMADLRAGLGIGLFWVCLVAWLFGAVVAGGVLGTRGHQRVRVGEFLSAGGHHFFKMLRVGLVFAAGYYLLGRIVLEAWALSVADGEAWASSSSVAWWGERIREGAMVLGFLWLGLACDLARAELALTDRSSACLAVLRGFGRTLRHPLRTSGVALAFGLPATVLLVGVGLASRWIPGDGTLGLIGLFLTIQVAVYLRLFARAGRLVGLATLVAGR